MQLFNRRVRRSKRTTWAAWAAVALAVSLATAAAATPPPKLAIHDAPREIQSFAFEGGAGEPNTLADFRGQVVVLNLWATWCPPCRDEMPTLDELQERLGGDEFQVVALSMDRSGAQAVRDFYSELGIDHLRLYIDSNMRAMSRLRIQGLPTTLILDRQGREIARLIGETDWSAPKMIRYLRGVIAKRPSKSASGGTAVYEAKQMGQRR